MTAPHESPGTDWHRIYLLTMTTMEMVAVWIIALCVLFR
jgi:hypothetical protein